MIGTRFICRGYASSDRSVRSGVHHHFTAENQPVVHFTPLRQTLVAQTVTSANEGGAAPA
jgi:hypothetical protein